MFQQDGVPPHFGQVVGFLNQRYVNQNIGHAGSVTWPPRSPEQTPLDICVWGLERDYLQDESTDESGTLVSNYGCCCWRTRIPYP
jgi:hypothetical protein